MDNFFGEKIKYEFGNSKSDFSKYKVAKLKQIHSNKVEVAKEAGDNLFEADGLVTKEKGLYLGIKTADCVPVLFADEQNGVVGACHAGYKGAFGNVMRNTILKMIELGARKENIKAMIGPCIHQKSYEIDASFRDKVLVMDEDNKKYFIPSVKEGHFMFDLKQYVIDRLDGFEVRDVNINTYDEEEYNSYRRSCHRGEREYYNQLSVICLL